ncbi:MAG: TAXI family TRAP transporter solute-binding subunit, partial [Rhodospirillaceae bacterium]
LWDDLLGAYEMTVDDIGQYFEVSQDFNVQGICGNQIDAFALWIGHPASLIQEAISECNAEVKGIWGDPVASMISAQPYLFRLELPEATYHPFAPGEDPCSPSGEGYLAAAATLDAECEAARPKLTTYGFKASLLAREEARPDVVYHLVKTVIEHTEYFKSRHPALGTVNMCDMVNKGNYLEFHEGAARYYWERGWLPRGSYDPRDAECGGTVPMLRLPSQ